jgi:hypothetical protein
LNRRCGWLPLPRGEGWIREAVYPQSLLVDLWITCSPIPARHANQALQPSGQKTTSLSHGFSGLFWQDNLVSCPQSLLALLWIRCSLSAEAHTNRGFQRVDQKTVNSSVSIENCHVNPRFHTASNAFPQTRQSYPRTLLALLWITCSSSATGHEKRGLQEHDQKLTNASCKPCFWISHDFSSQISQLFFHSSTVTPICCGWVCG